MGRSATFAEWIDMGTLAAFQKRVKSLNGEAGVCEYRFEPSNGDFWLFEAENAEEILGAILHVRSGRVYAISEDVQRFVRDTFE